MNKIKFLVEKGALGNSTRIDINSLEIKNPCMVTFNYDCSKILGTAHLSIKDGAVYAEMELRDELRDLYPAIGVKVEKTNQSILKNAKVFELALCNKPNTDVSILKISDQLR